MKNTIQYYNNIYLTQYSVYIIYSTCMYIYAVQVPVELYIMYIYILYTYTYIIYNIHIYIIKYYTVCVNREQGPLIIKLYYRALSYRRPFSMNK